MKKSVHAGQYRNKGRGSGGKTETNFNNGSQSVYENFKLGALNTARVNNSNFGGFDSHTLDSMINKNEEKRVKGIKYEKIMGKNSHGHSLSTTDKH